MTNKIISFFINHPEYFLKVISEHYPFSKAQLKKYKDSLLWEYVSSNETIGWSSDIIDTFTEQINWRNFTTNPSAFLDLSFLDKYVSRIDWKGQEVVYGDSITANKGLPWNDDFIERFESKIDFEKLSESEHVEWSEQLIDKYLDKWKMSELACNQSIPWTLRLFEKYLDTSYFQYFPVKGNIALISNIDFIEKYKEDLAWDYIFANQKLPWIELDLMNRWEDKIDWWGVALNELLFQCDNNFFYKHFDKWKMKHNGHRGFVALSRNKSLPWTKEFIEEYKELWDWEELSENEGLPWRIELIEHFANKMKWGGFLPDSLVDEDGNEIAPVGGISFNDGLIINESLPWSIGFLNRYESQLEFQALTLNRMVWGKAFNPYVDDKMVDTVFRII